MNRPTDKVLWQFSRKTWREEAAWRTKRQHGRHH